MAQRRGSFKELVQQAQEANADRLFRKARYASWVAKAAYGRGRRAAYQRKHQLLARLIEMGVVSLSPDDETHSSLFLVHRPGLGSLHSHQRWISNALQGR